MRENNTLKAIKVFLLQTVGAFSIDSLGLYALTLASELPVILVRATFLYLIVGLTYAIQGHGTDPPVYWLEVALIPTFWSILALMTPFGTGWWWKQRSGGRATPHSASSSPTTTRSRCCKPKHTTHCRYRKTGT
jgi:hypothetical protein